MVGHSYLIAATLEVRMKWHCQLQTTAHGKNPNCSCDASRQIARIGMRGGLGFRKRALGCRQQPRRPWHQAHRQPHVRPGGHFRIGGCGGIGAVAAPQVRLVGHRPVGLWCSAHGERKGAWCPAAGGTRAHAALLLQSCPCAVALLSRSGSKRMRRKLSSLRGIGKCQMV